MVGDQGDKYAEHVARFGEDRVELAQQEPWYFAHLEATEEAQLAAEQQPKAVEDFQQTKRAAWKALAVLVVAPVVIFLGWFGVDMSLKAYESWKIEQARPTEDPGRENPINHGGGPSRGNEPYRPTTHEEFMRLLRGTNPNSSEPLDQPLLPLDGDGKDIPILRTNPWSGYHLLPKDKAAYRKDGQLAWYTAVRKDTGARITLNCITLDNSQVRDTNGRYYLAQDLNEFGNPNAALYRIAPLVGC